jgi:hypothetical protein
MLKLKVFVRLLNPWSLSLLFTVKTLYVLRPGRMIKQARQKRTTHLRRTVNTSSQWRFWLYVRVRGLSADGLLP